MSIYLGFCFYCQFCYLKWIDLWKPLIQPICIFLLFLCRQSFQWSHLLHRTLQSKTWFGFMASSVFFVLVIILKRLMMSYILFCMAKYWWINTKAEGCPAVQIASIKTFFSQILITFLRVFHEYSWIWTSNSFRFNEHEVKQIWWLFVHV